MTKNAFENDPPPGTSSDEEVGYRKPPKNGRFQPGHSGHKRRKAAKPTTLAEEIKKCLNQFVLVSEGGKRVKRTKRQVLTARIVQYAMKKNKKARKLLLKLDRRDVVADHWNNLPPIEPFTEEHLELLKKLEELESRHKEIP
jgi:Family of unknown function (DUF5681)